MQKIKHLLLLFALFVSVESFAQVRKYSNEFLSIGVGARALGMSNANVASVNDVTAGYWNPAGLNLVESDIQFALMHSEYFAGIAKFDYGAIAIPTKDNKRVLALSLVRFAVDDIPNTLKLIQPDGSINYNNITTFSVADYALLLSYAQPIAWKNLRVGGNAKIIHRTAGEFAKAWGFGIDLGAQLDVKDFKFALMARDITTTFNSWSFNFTDEEQAIFAQTNNVIPENSSEITTPKIILGAAYNKAISKKVDLVAEVNFDFTTDGKRNVLVNADPVSIDPHLGVELGYSDFVYLRGGVGNVQRSTDFDGEEIYSFQPNLGVGINIRNLAIDYAYTDIGNQSEALYSHVFSLKVNINKKEKSGS